jgi:Uma2 family endonuclease
MNELRRGASNHRGRNPKSDEEDEAWEAIRHGYNGLCVYALEFSAERFHAQEFDDRSCMTRAMVVDGHLFTLHHAEHIMAMPATQDLWTVDMLDALPEDLQRYELIDGMLHVTPAPSDAHQLVAGEFYARLREYLREATEARALFSPADVRREDRSRNRLQPDVFVFRLREGKHPAYPYDMSDLLLAIEVESPSNPELDYQVKRPLYQRAGIEYWVVSPTARVVSRWKADVSAREVLSERIEWLVPGRQKPLVISIQELFDQALR